MNPLAHILLVEDDPGLCKMLRATLELHGFPSSETASRIAALEKLRIDTSISVVILDLGLPPAAHGISEGIATLRAIQSDMRPVKVIVLTGQDQEAAALAAIREGAFDFLTKPASSAVILGAIKRAMLFSQKEMELAKEGITRISINAQAGDGLKVVRADAEERLVRLVLKETGFNVYQSAKRLGVKRENIYYFLKKFSIERDEP
jgi:two-component system, response regulator RegA